MELVKFKEEIGHLDRFFVFYCKENHTCQKSHPYFLEYKDEVIQGNIEVCEACEKQLRYARKKLMACRHDPKPRCRTCQEPCYQKQEWRALAKVMRYSALRLGLSKLVSFVMDPFKAR